jgi:transcriptional antiterminator RfaH
MRIVLDGQHPARVPDAVIEDLREDSAGFVVLPKAKPAGLQRGDSVRVIDGIFAGQLAVFEGMKPRERVLVLLTMLGSQRAVELAKAIVRPV